MSHSLNFTVLKALRKQKGITLHDISKSTGISPTTLCGIENNSGNPNLETIAKLADALPSNILDIFVNPDVRK